MRKKLILVGAIVFVLIGIIVTTILVRQSQDNRQRASDDTPTSTPTITPTPGPSMDAVEWDFLRIINEYRQSLGISPLKPSIKLTKSSEWMSNDMATRNVLSHVDSQGRNIDTRIPSFGYSGSPIAENVGYTTVETAQSIFEGFKNECDPDSSGTCGYLHKKQMEDTRMQAIGIARALSGNRWYWTTDFGSTLDAELIPTATPTPTETPTATLTPTGITATETATPTSTSAPTATLTPTATTGPTNTPFPTEIFVNTPTPTSILPTATAVPTLAATLTPTTAQPTASIAPTAAATLIPTATITPIPPTNTPLPPIAKPGGIVPTLGLIGGILIVVIGGFFLLVL